MLKKKRQYNHFSQRWMLMLSHLAAYSENRNQEELHKLRVEMKKIKALVKLAEKCSTSKDLTATMAPLKKVFKGAGEIRNLQIELDLQKQHPTPGQRITQLQKEIDRKSKAFIKQLEIKALEKTYEELANVFKGIGNNSVIRLYKKQKDKLEKTFSEKNEWHNGRKVIKRLLYIHDVLNKNLKKKLKLNLPYLEKLEESLGQWHDLELSVNAQPRTNRRNPVKTQYNQATHQLARLLQRFHNRVEVHYH